MAASPASTGPASGAAASTTAPRAAAATKVFSWEEALQHDPRVSQMQRLMEQILRTNFPAVGEKLRKEEPPARRYEAPAQPLQQQSPGQTPAAANSGGRPAAAERAQAQAQAKTHPTAFQLHGYSSESSSEIDMREVDPMDELSDFETQPTAASAPAAKAACRAAQQKQSLSVSRTTDADGDDEMDGGNDANDFEMDGEEDEDDEDDTACVVCNTSENERQILLCDKCNGEYHMYCLTPPLMEVPLDEWFCPRCAPTQPEPAVPAPVPASVPAPAPVHKLQVTPKRERESAAEQSSVSSVVSASSVTTASIAPSSAANGATPYQQRQQNQQSAAGEQQKATHSNGQRNGSSFAAPPLKQQYPEPPRVSVAHKFESDAEKSNQLLIHACQCDESKCSSAVFHEFCPHMKRFLRSACWASHSEKWRGYRVAKVTAELFAYHAMHCHEPQCNVPMCDQLRAEEFV